VAEALQDRGTEITFESLKKDHGREPESNTIWEVLLLGFGGPLD